MATYMALKSITNPTCLARVLVRMEPARVVAEPGVGAHRRRPPARFGTNAIRTESRHFSRTRGLRARSASKGRRFAAGSATIQASHRRAATQPETKPTPQGSDKPAPNATTPDEFTYTGTVQEKDPGTLAEGCRRKNGAMLMVSTPVNSRSNYPASRLLARGFIFNFSMWTLQSHPSEHLGRKWICKAMRTANSHSLRRPTK